jgi:cell division protein FtsI/penicillin-binding protein 2
MTEKRGRILFILLMLSAGFVAVGLRLFHLQVIERGDLSRRAERQQERLVKLEPKRGTIVDRQGRELAVSLDVESVYGVPTDVEDPRPVARQLARILQENPRARLDCQIANVDIHLGCGRGWFRRMDLRHGRAPCN